MQLCGDAHLSNFGFFASPERRLVFDINDFDETLPGPWEWDVKRLVASVEIAGRDRGFTRAERHAARRVRPRGPTGETMRQFADMTTLDVWYACVDVGEVNPVIVPQAQGGAAQAGRAEHRQGPHARPPRFSGRFATVVDGAPRLTAAPPLVVPLRDLLPDRATRADFESDLRRPARGYRESLPADRRLLLDQYRLVDIARKVVGVGSVGTRSWMVLMLGRDDHDPLFLQAKEAGTSVLEAHLGRGEARQPGQAGRRWASG